MPCRTPGQETLVYVALSFGRPYGLMGKSTRHDLSLQWTTAIPMTPPPSNAENFLLI